MIYNNIDTLTLIFLIRHNLKGINFYFLVNNFRRSAGTKALLKVILFNFSHSNNLDLRARLLLFSAGLLNRLLMAVV